MIRKYTASADNTIVSAYELNLTTRGTGSNAGRADILETFQFMGAPQQVHKNCQEF